MLDEQTRRLAKGKNFASLTTLRKDGSPTAQVMWVDCDDEHVLINTEVHRQKFKNLSTDPRVTVTVFNADNPYQYVEARGRVVGTEAGPVARENIDELSRKYTGNDYGTTVQSERVIVRITPERIHKNGY